MNEKQKEANKRWRKRNPKKYKAYINQYQKTYYPSYYQKIKNEVFHHYCDDNIKCANCGAIEELSIDHIEGNGTEHRLMLGFNSSYQFYLWLRSNNFPPNYRILCRSCNSHFKNTKGSHFFNTSKMVLHHLRRFGKTRARDLIKEIAPFTSSKRAVSMAILRLFHNGKIKRITKGVYSI